MKFSPYALKNINSTAGIGLRPPHLEVVAENRPQVSWFEVHSDQFMGDVERKRNVLEKIRQDYPISIHGVNLSLGSVDGLDITYLKGLKHLIEWIEPGLVSEHLAWNRLEGVYFHDLLALPYTEESLEIFVRNLNAAQDFLGCKLLIENPSLFFHFPFSTIPEAEFLNEMVKRTSCGLLLDINNVVVSSHNTNADALSYLKTLSLESVEEIHLAGHQIHKHKDGEIRIDTHDRVILKETWDLYEKFLDLAPRQIPSLVEWDADLPDFQILLEEAQKIDHFLNIKFPLEE